MPQVTFIAIPASQKTKSQTRQIQSNIVSYHIMLSVLHSEILWKLTCCAENKPERINRQRSKNTKQKKEKKLIKTNELMFHACSFLALNKKTIRSLSRCFGICSATFPKLISTKHFTTFLNWFIRAEEILFACFSARVHVLFSYMLWASECWAIGIIFPYSQQYWNNVAVWTTEERKRTKNRFSENARWIALVYVLNIGGLVQHRAWCFHEWVSHHITYIKHHRFFRSFLHTNHVNATVFRLCMKFISSHSKSICIEEFILLKRAAIKHNYTWSNLMRWTCTIDCCSDRRFLSPISLALFHPFSSNESFMDHYWTFGWATRKEWKQERERALPSQFGSVENQILCWCTPTTINIWKACI